MTGLSRMYKKKPFDAERDEGAQQNPNENNEKPNQLKETQLQINETKPISQKKHIEQNK